MKFYALRAQFSPQNPFKKASQDKQFVFEGK
jgi:hypothetical protein